MIAPVDDDRIARAVTMTVDVTFPLTRRARRSYVTCVAGASPRCPAPAAENAAEASDPKQTTLEPVKEDR
jgi:hypothetical protein